MSSKSSFVSLSHLLWIRPFACLHIRSIMVQSMFPSAKCFFPADQITWPIRVPPIRKTRSRVLLMGHRKCFGTDAANDYVHLWHLAESTPPGDPISNVS